MSNLSFLIEELGFSEPNEDENNHDIFQEKNSELIAEIGLSLSEEDNEIDHDSLQMKTHSTNSEKLGFSSNDENGILKSNENSTENRAVESKSPSTVIDIQIKYQESPIPKNVTSTSDDRRSIFYDYWRKGSRRNKSLFGFHKKSTGIGNATTCKLQNEKESHKNKRIFTRKENEEIYNLVTAPLSRPSTTVKETYIAPHQVVQLKECFRELLEHERAHENKINKMNTLEDNLNRQISYLKAQVAEKRKKGDNLNRQIKLMKHD